jgi:excinuclease ABC subunit C
VSRAVKISAAPQTPGVYFFRGKNRRVLYIGKAANLKNRIRSYFSAQKDSRISKMLESAASIDWQETGSEVEALILESQLIKKYRPQFNITLRDDKQYFFVGLTEEMLPKVFITHQPIAFSRLKIPSSKSQILNKSKISNSKIGKLEPATYNLEPNFIGPFTDGTALRATLKLLRGIFPYCTCKQRHNNYCLNYHLGNCPGFCCLKAATRSERQATKQKREYRKNIKAISDILHGKKTSLIKGFKKEMNALAQKSNLEKAIELRDKIEKLEKIFENAQILRNTKYKIFNTGGGQKQANSLTAFQAVFNLPRPPHRIEGYDISNIQGEFATGAMAVFVNGYPDKNEYRKFKIRTAGGLPAGKAGDTGMLKEIIIRRFNHPEWPYPDLILIDGGKAQLNAACSVISKQISNRKLQIPIITLTKDIKHKGDHIYASTKKSAVPLKNLPPVVRNLILQIDAEAHRFAINYYRKLHKKIFK